MSNLNKMEIIYDHISNDNITHICNDIFDVRIHNDHGCINTHHAKITIHPDSINCDCDEYNIMIFESHIAIFDKNENLIKTLKFNK